MKWGPDVNLLKATPAMLKLMFDLKLLKINWLVPEFRDFLILIMTKGVKVLISGIPNQKTYTMSEVQLTAYNVKTKEKGVPIMDAVITKTAKGAYMVQGHDGKGNKLTTLVNEEKAMAAIKAGIAKQGW
jgi:hypothetical protein